MNSKYYVYILKSEANDGAYTGFTTDLENRLRQHNENIEGYTKNRGPWKLIWYCVFEGKKQAKEFEKYLKTGSGIAFARKRLMMM